MGEFFSFRGRLSRKGWWIACLVATAIVIVPVVSIWLGLFMAESKGSTTEIDVMNAMMWTGVVLTLAFIPYAWIILAATIKRLHDRNRSGWFALIQIGAVASLVFVPIIGSTPSQIFVGMGIATAFRFAIGIAQFWLLIECGFLSGSPGMNRFGSPSSEAGASDFSYLDPEITQMVVQRGDSAAPTRVQTRVMSTHERTEALRPAPNAGFGRRGA